MRLSLTRRAAVITAATLLAGGAAGAATLHTYSVSNGTGSEGATAFVQTTASGSALQGEVNASPNTSIKIPFGVLGEYDTSGGPFGIGVAGISTTGYAIGAEAFGTSPTMIALAGGNGVALEAITPTSSTAPAIFSFGQGTSDGILSYEEAHGSSSTSYYAATAGFDLANDNGYNVGVLGSTNNGSYGVEGIAGNGSNAAVGAVGTGTAGLYASSDTTTAVVAASKNGDAMIAEQLTAGSPAAYTYEQAGLSASSENGAGVYSYSAQDPSVYAEMGCNVTTSFASAQGQNCSGVFIQVDGTNGFPFEVYEPNNSNCTYPAYLNAGGTFYVCGTVITGANAKSRNPGSDVETYSAQQTESTVEDLGSAQLVNGEARVPLNPDYRKTIDVSRQYMVFVMPSGENHGLYVASRSPDGFVIRESAGGHSTTAFDYRIVAHVAGTRQARLPHSSDMLNALGAPHRATSYASLRRAAELRASGNVTNAKFRSIGEPMGAAMRARLLHPKAPSNPFGIHRT